MALKVGFAKTFYTLWDVVSNVEYINTEAGYFPTQKVHYTYIQNLSKDEKAAQDKAQSMGCQDTEVDNELYGRNNSFSTINKLYSELPNTLSPFFEFGKYTGALINQSTDIDYLIWYYKETSNRYAKSILENNGYVDYRDYGLCTYEQIQNIEQALTQQSLGNDILDQYQTQPGNITITFERNLSSNGVCKYEGVDVLFQQFKVMDYNGFEYGLPTIKGVGKKIKGKSIQAVVETVPHIFDECNRMLKVIEWKFI